MRFCETKYATMPPSSTGKINAAILQNHSWLLSRSLERGNICLSLKCISSVQRLYCAAVKILCWCSEVGLLSQTWALLSQTLSFLECPKEEAQLLHSIVVTSSNKQLKQALCWCLPHLFQMAPQAILSWNQACWRGHFISSVNPGTANLTLGEMLTHN